MRAEYPNDDDDMLRIQPYLRENSNRFVLFPISHYWVWAHYKTLLNSLWCCEEIDINRGIAYSEDGSDFGLDSLIYGMCTLALKLNQHYMDYTIEFLNELKPAEYKSFLSFQLQSENVHGETYSRILNELDPMRDASNLILHYQSEDWYQRMIQIAGGVMEEETLGPNGSLKGESIVARNAQFPYILVKYAIRRFLFSFTIHYVLYRIGTRFDLRSALQCWVRISRDVNEYVAFVIRLYEESVNKVGRDYILSELELTLSCATNYLTHVVFDNDVLKEMTKSEDLAVREFPQECLRDTLGQLDHYVSALRTMLGGDCQDDGDEQGTTTNASGFMKTKVSTSQALGLFPDLLDAVEICREGGGNSMGGGGTGQDCDDKEEEEEPDVFVINLDF